MNVEDDFNSSDLEVPESINPNANLGKASIEAMLADAFELRKSTKVKGKQINSLNVLGAPGTQKDRSRWANRFSSFYSVVLGKRYVYLVTSSTHQLKSGLPICVLLRGAQTACQMGIHIVRTWPDICRNTTSPHHPIFCLDSVQLSLNLWDCSAR
jgi:hypothetical protein